MAGLLTGLGGFNNTSLPWPLKSSRDFAETPAHYLFSFFVIITEYF
jgi:hypothetical protein